MNYDDVIGAIRDFRNYSGDQAFPGRPERPETTATEVSQAFFSISAEMQNIAEMKKREFVSRKSSELSVTGSFMKAMRSRETKAADHMLSGISQAKAFGKEQGFLTESYGPSNKALVS